MPYTPITPNAATALQSTYDGITNGDTANATYVNPILQKIVDNLHRAKKTTYTSPTDLTAISSPVSGEIFHVIGYGDYVYLSSLTDAVESPYIIDGPSSVGRYVYCDALRVHTDVRADSPFLAGCASDGFVESPIKNQVIAIDGIVDDAPSPGYTASDSYVYLGEWTLTGTPHFEIDDVLDIHICGRCDAASGDTGSKGYLRLDVYADSIDYPLAETVRTYAHGTNNYFSISALCKFGIAPTAVSIRLYGAHDSTGLVFTLISQITGSVTRYRHRVGSTHYSII